MFGSVRLGSFRFSLVRFRLFRFVSFRFVSFRFVSFRFVSASVSVSGGLGAVGVWLKWVGCVGSGRTVRREEEK